MTDKNYWNQRYLDDNAPWDAGSITTPLAHYIDGLPDKSIHILIPGAGFAHEGAYLYNKGFTNVFICDWAPAVIEAFQQANPDFPKEQLICGDFFKIERQFDLIIEQTFFCAMPPKFRQPYVDTTARLLKPGGMIVGLLFAQEFEKDGPPWGGTKPLYEKLVETKFDIIEMDLAQNSIKPRAGSELFIRLRKKSV